MTTDTPTAPSSPATSDGLFQGAALVLETHQVKAIRIRPDAGLSDRVRLVARYADAAEFAALEVVEGSVVSIRQKPLPPGWGAASAAFQAGADDRSGRSPRRRGFFARLWAWLQAELGPMRNTISVTVVDGDNVTGRSRRTVTMSGGLTIVNGIAVVNGRLITLELDIAVPPGFPLTVTHGGPGPLTIGDVGGSLALSVTSIGDAAFGAMRSVTLRVSGTGDAEGRDVTETADVVLSSVGGASLGAVGALDAQVSGTGDLEVGPVRGTASCAATSGGSITTGPVGGGLAARVHGTGDVTVGAVRGALAATLSSSGGLEVARVDGDVEAELSGTGDLTIRDGEVGGLRVDASSVGSFAFRGTARDADLRSSGTGDVAVARVTGALRERASSVGDITVRRRG